MQCIGFPFELSSYIDEEIEAGEGEADEDSLVDEHRPVEDVAPQQRQREGQGANKVYDGVGDCLWKGRLVWSDLEGGRYHLIGEECDGDDEEAVKVGDHVSLHEEEGVEIGGEAEAHLVKLK